jgi:glycosyltransferase involved in cell wall biosynthesis
LAEVEVVIAHGSSTLPACALATLWSSTPFVYRQISDPRVWSASRLRRLRTGLAISRATRVVALSDLNWRQLIEHLRVSPSRLRVIPNGVPPDAFRPASAEDRARARRTLGIDDLPTVLYVGSLSPEKGPDLAVEAMALLHHERAQLVMVGDGPARSTISAQADELPRAVHVLGSLDDLHAVYAAADVFVLSSRTEAMPGALIEAGLAGLPAVAFSVGAVREVIQDGRTGKLVPPGDVRQLAQAIDGLLLDPEGAARLGTAAREHCVARFGIDEVARSWDEVLTEVVAPR